MISFFLRPLGSVLLFGLLLNPLLIHSQEGSGQKSRIGDKEERERLEAWESISPEHREKLREALRGVWTDPAVINAREEVKHATDAYQAAIKSSVAKLDPELGEVLAKLQNAGKGGDRGPSGAGGPMMGPGRGFDEQIRPPGFLDSLEPKEREKFRKAEGVAFESEPVKAARAELDEIRKEDDTLRRKRIEAHRKIRKVTVEEMIRIDPSIAEIHKRLLEEGGASFSGKTRKKSPDGEGDTPRADGKAAESEPRKKDGAKED